MTAERDDLSDPQLDLEMDVGVRAWLVETDLSAAEATPGLTRLMDGFPVTPQARRRFLERFFERGDGGMNCIRGTCWQSSRRR